uniref:Uncharacterized protein n=1 Tax=Kalanchoe fedtschenkoi TaxID=63787 RepID=A0A7N0RCQ5_KALFE
MKKIGKETSPIRLAGQRSITASLPFGSSDRSCVSQTGSPGGSRNISLSDFLSRKLHKSVVLPETDKDKQKLSSSVVCRRNFSGPLILQNGVDNDEIGACEVWEGVGSSTLGGLDWH